MGRKGRFIVKRITEELLERRTMPTITAHSGCEGTADNSMEHVRAAIASGAEMLEIDVREKDGLLYMWHDEGADVSACVTLEECFREVAPTALCVNCDVKTAGLAAPVIALAARFSMEERIVFTGSVHPDELPALNASAADWWQGLWFFDDDPANIGRIADLYREQKDLYKIVNINYGLADNGIADAVTRAGYPLSVWTANDEPTIRRMLANPAVKNITTRLPRLALEIRREIYGE